MQQRQLRLGDILDDYCPRERRVTNHVIVAMIGEDVKQTRCTTCDADHEYKHAKIPRQRRKNEAPAALYAQVAAGAPKRVSHDASMEGENAESLEAQGDEAIGEPTVDPAADRHAKVEGHQDADGTGADDASLATASDQDQDEEEREGRPDEEEADERESDGDGPIHRRLIRASLPRPEGHQPPARPIPEFTIRQPAGRQNRFRPRHQQGGGGGQQGPRGGQQFGGNRSNGNMGGGGPMRGPRPSGGRPGGGGLMNRRGPSSGGGGRKRSK